MPIDPAKDMGANFAHMIGQKKEYEDVARMYFILHSDYESGNVSAHTTFYTVLFGVGRALGCMANITWDRALGYAIEPPKSVTTSISRSGPMKVAGR